MIGKWYNDCIEIIKTFRILELLACFGVKFSWDSNYSQMNILFISCSFDGTNPCMSAIDDNSILVVYLILTL